jgi:hypothetical protein
MTEWRDATVDDHSSGITDLVTASSPDFQEICRNLQPNTKIKVLSSRDGYRRFTTQTTPTKIQQLFKLEDWLIAYCHADPSTTTEQVSGKLYYRLESDTSSAWTEVITPKDRTTVSFRIYDSTGKGLVATKTTGTMYDTLVVKASEFGAGPTYAPQFTEFSTTKTLYLAVQTSRLSASKKYDKGGGTGNLTWAWFQSNFPANWTISLFSGTSSSDEVIFDEVLAVQTTTTPIRNNDGSYYPANARSDGSGTTIPFINEQGHLQSSEWQSHLYMSLEPYVKTYTSNASDPYGEDPDTYAPDNNRLPLRKIAPIAKPVGEHDSPNPPGYQLKALNAQLPKSYIGIDTAESTVNTYSSSVSNYRYQVYKIQFAYQSSAYVSDTSPWIEIWCERSWGQQGSGGTMTTKAYLAYTYFAATKNPMDDTKQFALADPNLSALAPYTGIATLAADWDMLYLCYHERNSAGADIPSMAYSTAVAAIQAAFTEYNARRALSGGTYYYSAYENFGFYIKSNSKAKQSEPIDVTAAPTISYWYADSLPEDVPGNYSYSYAFFLRDTYQGAFEGTPRQFIFDGPVAFLDVRTLSPMGKGSVKGYSDAARTSEYEYFMSPTVYGGITTRITQSTDLYFQSTIDGVFARTTNGGSTYYIETTSKYWWRGADLSGLGYDFPTSLLTDGWATKMAYAVPWQSTTPDDELELLEQAYFNNGVLGYDAIPQGPYYFTVVNQTGYAANIVNNIQRVYESTPGVPHALPATMFDDFDDEITGITSFLDKPIVATQNKLWRIEGSKASDGSGRTFLRTISDEFGCIANQSLVVTNIGIFLWSNSGIIYTDGIRAFRVTEHLFGTYKTWLTNVRASTGEIGPKQLRGRYDELNRLIYWSSKDENSKPFFVVLSLQKGVSPTMPITTHDGVRFKDTTLLGVVTNVDYFQTHATLYSDDYRRLYRSQDTYLLYADDSRTYDESHVTGLKHPVLPYYKSVAFAYGIPWARKQTSRFLLTLRDTTQTGVSLTPLGWNDLSTVPERLRNCLCYQHMPFSLDYATASLLDLQQFFKHSDCQWQTETVVSYKRAFGKGRTRNIFKQVGFEGMKLKYSSWDPSVAMPSAVTDLRIVTKNSFPQSTAFIQVTVSSLVSNAVIDLALDKSGQFLVSWEDDMEPVPVSTMSLSGSTYTIIVILDTSNMSNGSDYTELWPKIRWYRYFTDQKIDMIGYNLTYRLLGDRSNGMLKSAAKGGVDA